MAVTPCKHFFHWRCIMLWHTSPRPERSTCPLCRRRLFIADPLTEEQVQQLGIRTRPPRREEVFSHLRQNEVLLSWDVETIHDFAQRGVDKVIDYMRTSRRQRRLYGYSWIELCQRICDAILPRGGRVRLIFRPHQPTFFCAVVAAVVLHHITRHPSATRAPAFRMLVDWVDMLINTLGESQFHALYREFRRNGLFMSDSYAVAPVTDSYVRFHIGAAARVRSVSAEMKAQAESPRWKQFLRGVKYFAVRDLDPQHDHRTGKTLAEVLCRIPDRGLLHCFPHETGSTDVSFLGLDWSDFLMVETSNSPDARS